MKKLYFRLALFFMFSIFLPYSYGCEQEAKAGLYKKLNETKKKRFMNGIWSGILCKDNEMSAVQERIKNSKNILVEQTEIEKCLSVASKGKNAGAFHLASDGAYTGIFMTVGWGFRWVVKRFRRF